MDERACSGYPTPDPARRKGEAQRRSTLHDPNGPPDERPFASEPDPGDGPRLPQGLRDVVLFLPRFAVMLGKLIADPEVSSTDKLLIAGAVAYMLSPFDLIPDVVPVIGQLDDAYLVALCLLRLLNRSGEAKIRQHWDGPEDVVHIIHTISDYATRYLPGPVRNAVRGWVEARDTGAPPGDAGVPPADPT